MKVKKILLYCSAALLLCCASSFAQMPVQPPAEIPVEPVKTLTIIEIKDGLLSVELSDANFGSVMKEIAEKVKFKLEISNTVASKKISTSFKEVEIERGIRRLFTVINEKDFTISYGAGGFIDKIEIFGGNQKPPSTPLKKPQTTRPPQKPVTPIMPPQMPQNPYFLPPPPARN